jgi:predicted RNase H-like nuclease (RuvC/YqgF family)
MSFVELRESFDNVKDYIAQATRKLSVLSTVFEELRDAEENYANSLTLISRRINEDLVGSNEITPLTQAFSSLEEYLSGEAKLHYGLAK